jgi:adenine-specific DNA-methyltransferase
MLDEIFGVDNFVNTIAFKKKSATLITESVFDVILWYCKSSNNLKLRDLYNERVEPEEEAKFNTLVTEPMIFNNVARATTEETEELQSNGARWARVNYPIVSQHPSETRSGDDTFCGRSKICGDNKQWRFSAEEGLPRIEKAGRIFDGGGKSLGGVVFWDDWNRVGISNIWSDIHGEKFPLYVVQTAVAAIQRCILLATDPGDLILDPTCGSGTTPHVAEQWGRRWITIDTSRVALALARARIMGARYPYYLLADSKEGQLKEAEITRSAPSSQPTHGNLRHGFVYQRVPHITLKSIANNAEIDVIWEKWQPKLQDALDRLNAVLRGHTTSYKVTTGGRQGKPVRFDAPEGITFTMPSGEIVPAYALVEWEVPRETPADWPQETQEPLADFWEARIARQREIDASIATKADFEYLYDKPYEDKGTVRVAGPFTVESLSPHRVLGVDEDDELIGVEDGKDGYGEERDFVSMILENLKTAGVQQAHKEDRISFRSLKPWPGELICAEGVYSEGGEDSGVEKRAAIFIGPEFGTVSRPDLVSAAREAGDADFDVLITCAFNYDARSSDFNKLGRIPVLKARMNADLHMADDLKNTGKGNLFVIFGEPDIDILDAPESDPESDQAGQIQVKIKGVDVFHPQTGEVRSDGPEGIACWFIDTDYNEESFFVRHAYFLGANDPYKALKTTLKAEIDQEAWESLHSDTSRPFPKPTSGRIAVKVINHLGDEVMKVFRS